MLTSERAKVVRIACHNDRTAEADRGRDYGRVDRVTRIETITREQASRRASDAMIERDHAVGSADDPVNRRVAPRASIDLGEYRGRDANEHIPLGGFREDGLRATSGDASFLHPGQRAQSLAVEKKERAHAASGAPPARAGLVRPLDLVEGGGCFGDEPLVRWTQHLLELPEEL